MRRTETSRRRLVGIRGVIGAWALGLAMTVALLWALGADLTSASGAAAAIVVDTTEDELVDDDKCSLREAIAAANGDAVNNDCTDVTGAVTDTIELLSGTYVLSITGTMENNSRTGDLDVLAGMTIYGTGPEDTIIDAAGIDRIFDVALSADEVVISGMTLRGGDSPGHGGCIDIYGTDLSLVDVVLRDCLATDYGGGLRAMNSARVVLSATEVISCSAERGGGVYIDGGRLTIDGGRFVGNAAIASDTSYGGGIYMVNAVTASASDGEIISNTADFGGALSVGGAYLTLNGGRIAGNEALDGGGIHVRGSGAKVTMTEVDITDNMAIGSGGGIFIGSGTATMSVGQIAGNVADTGGGVYISQDSATFSQMEACTITHNTAATSGGGLYVNNGIAHLEGGTVYSNTAESTDDEEGGGGLMVRYGLVEATGGQVLENAAHRGAGVYVMDAEAVFTQTAGLVAGNVATVEGGGFYVRQGAVGLVGGVVSDNAAEFGAGIYTYQGSAVLAGGEVLNNTAAVAGGGVLVYTTTGWLEMRSGQIAGNTAKTGGGVYVENGSAMLAGGELSGNSADWGAGVAVISSTAALTQTGGAIAFNDAVEDGGGVYINQGRVALTGAIVGNEAEYGGGIYGAQGTATIVNSTISANIARQWGGGLYNVDSMLSVTYTTIAENSAKQGSGIYYESEAPAVVNTILANETENCNQALASNGYNLEYGDSCGLTVDKGDLTDEDPKLEELTAEGGTWVHPLKEGSPAIDRGLCLVEIGLDQLGVPRPRGDGCDIGAYEFPLWELYLPLVLR